MKIIPSALIDTLTQTSGGTTIQNSYGGLQLHKKAYQKKKKTVLQQNARSAFTNVQSSWGSLSSGEQDSWNAAADPGTSGFQLYSSTNNRLVNQGIPIINEYVAPVTPPTSDLELSGASYNYGPGARRYTAEFTSPDSLLPNSGWITYIQWTGWILPSEYRFPPAKLIVAQSGITTFTEDELIFTVGETTGTNMTKFMPGAKAIFTINLLNITTGQIFELLQYQGGEIP